MTPRQAEALFCIARQPYQEPLARHDLGPMDIECSHCGALHWFDEKLTDSSARSPQFGSCCNSGQVRLPALEEPPPMLRDLFVNNTPQSREFRENIWKYNRAFAFTSLSVKEDHSVNRGRGEPVFRIQGELCHRSGPLTPTPGHRPTYAQLYIFEPRAALEHRVSQNQDLRRDTMQVIQDVLLRHHQYAPVYQHAHNVLREYNPNDDVSIRLRVDPSVDRRRYNLPTADEVAVILPGDGETSQPRDIVLHRRDGALRTISDLHPAYAPLQYVLLFPRGENGWHPDLTQYQPDREQPKRLTQTRYVAYRLQTRKNEFSTILRGGRLLQRYLVDMYAMVEQSRLRFLRLNQPLLRASLYSGLEDAMTHGDEDLDLGGIGQRFILPSSHIGSPRHMQQRFQDSLAIARYYKKVDVFCTMTCNPAWPEITRELLPGQTAYDRPDLVSRVFQLKKKAIVDYFYKHGVFGRAVAYVYTIEFQKRGLPHIHILIFFYEPYKLITTGAIDSCIRAEWPDPEIEPKLFETVKKCMVHGPCGAANIHSPCMEENVCTKKYPKSFQETTTLDYHGYPLYQRRDDGRAYKVGQTWVDNRWIVPYNPFLSATFNCHINVECAVSLGSFKYLFKYIQKGPDRASLEVNKNDEIQRFVDGRYISASEAMHRIFHFDLHDQDPNIVRLQVHLPGQHFVIYDPTEDPGITLTRAAREQTSLTAFFEANADSGPLGAEARKMVYQEFPQRFVWKDRMKKWALRQKGFALGRMYYVPPTGGERFYLRTLLTVVKGARSYQDLLTYNNVIHSTFHGACLARGLLEDDGEYRLCLEDAVDMQTGSSLRQLFATLLMHCGLAEPNVLWYDFRDRICDDVHWRLQAVGMADPTEEEVYDYGLYLLEQILKESGKSLEDWPSMPTVDWDWDAHIYNFNPLIAEQLDYHRDEERQQLGNRLPLLNTEQAFAYTTIVESIDRGLGKLFFLNGPGGTGKTYVYNTICHKVRSEGSIILCVASSGVAALLIRGGRTAHSMFKIPVENLTSETVCGIPKESQRAELIRRAKIVIWDEVGPQHRHALEAVDRTCRDLRNDTRPFGGLTVVLGGDFQQTLPIVPRGSREEIVNSTIQRSYLWNIINILYLHRNMRLEANPGDLDEAEFAQWLLDIGHRRGPSSTGTVRFPPQMLTENTSSLIDFIYPDVGSDPPPPPEYFLNRMILAPRNTDVADINETVLERMTGDSRTYYSIDEVIHEPGADGPEEPSMPAEFLRSITPSSLPPGELTLKIGCPVILLRNLSPSRGLCNGTRIIVTRMSDRVLEGRLIGGDHDGEIVLIPRISLIPTSSADFSFKLRRRQLPVRLALSLSINKAQGQSVKFVGLDARIPVFAHGQLYVALSRATSRHRVKVLLPHDQAQPVTANVVYPEVLLD